jgi:hypothetical protein
MKYLFALFVLTLSACAHTPMLVPGSCYTVAIPNAQNNSYIGKFSTFKVAEIFDMYDEKMYSIKTIDFISDTMSPKTRALGQVSVESFDRFVSPVAYPFAFDDPQNHKVTCPVTGKEPPVWPEAHQNQ